MKAEVRDELLFTRCVAFWGKVVVNVTEASPSCPCELKLSAIFCNTCVKSLGKNSVVHAFNFKPSARFM